MTQFGQITNYLRNAEQMRYVLHQIVGQGHKVDKIRMLTEQKIGNYLFQKYLNYWMLNMDGHIYILRLNHTNALLKTV